MTSTYRTDATGGLPSRQKRNGRRLIAQLLVCCGLLVPQMLPVAYAGTVAWQEDMRCGSDTSRQDRGAGLKEQVLETPNGSIGYFRFGHGSPIVLITGYRASMAEWNAYFLSDLAKHHEVVVFDNRGIGQSQMRGASYSVRDLAGDTAALIRGLHLKNATVLGWSMGGIIAQQLAIDEPSLVSKLILLSSMPPGPRAALPPAGVDQVLSGSGSGHFDRVMEVLFPASALPSAKACFIDDMFAPEGYAEPHIKDAVTHAQDLILQRWKQDNQALRGLDRVTVPTLILVGTSDKVLWPRNSVALTHILPDATLVEVKAGGHAMMYQYPRQLADRIVRFIATQ
ncbi:alpha/beta hydrolase [Paraburkholderia sediminicola]|uniref:alpha/beta fold hydrolase n=1 Tax=Paraburkholderia sediminicola TaxID=458836 RepID=UPI0038BCA1B2